MSLSPSRTAFSAIGDAAPAFPILMRLPDLRDDAPSPAEPSESTYGETSIVADAGEVAPIAKVEDAPLAPPTPKTEEQPPIIAQSSISAEPQAQVEAATAIPEQSHEATGEPASQEPASPAAARRQRALERQRRAESAPVKSSWWKSHAPVIAVGFLVALALTLYLARSNRQGPGPTDTASDSEIPELNIDMGGPSLDPPSTEGSSLGTPERIATAPASPMDDVASDAGSTSKSPSLLSAKPAVPAGDNDETKGSSNEPASELATEYTGLSSPATPALDLGKPTTAANDDLNYPSTDPASYRPGGRVPRVARSPEPAPNYPTTSAPNWR